MWTPWCRIENNSGKDSELAFAALTGRLSAQNGNSEASGFGHSIWWLRGNPKAQNPEGRDASRAPPGAVQKRLG